MKKRLSQLAVVITALFACLIFPACLDLASQTTDKETVVQNTIDIYALYEAYLQEYPDALFADFMQSLSIPYYDTEYATAKAIKSAVSVYSTFTKRVMVRPWQYSDRESVVSGAGVIYKITDSDVYIITNYHVIYDQDSTTEDKFADSIEVYIYGHEGGGGILATFLGGDMDKDIAVLKAKKADFQSDIKEATIADSGEVKLGSAVIAIGNPLSEGIAVTSGVVSVVSDTINMEALDSASRTVTMQVIRTDAAVNSGNSGGGLFNIRGELIGIVNAKTAQSGVENMGYAIPSNIMLEIVKEFVT